MLKGKTLETPGQVYDCAIRFAAHVVLNDLRRQLTGARYRARSVEPHRAVRLS